LLGFRGPRNSSSSNLLRASHPSRVLETPSPR
jgi:hypothetical protein